MEIPREVIEHMAKTNTILTTMGGEIRELKEDVNCAIKKASSAASREDVADVIKTHTETCGNTPALKEIKEHIETLKKPWYVNIQTIATIVTLVVLLGGIFYGFVEWKTTLAESVDRLQEASESTAASE